MFLSIFKSPDIKNPLEKSLGSISDVKDILTILCWPIEAEFETPFNFVYLNTQLPRGQQLRSGFHTPLIDLVPATAIKLKRPFESVEIPKTNFKTETISSKNKRQKK